MLSKDKIARINELSKRSKSTGLTKSEEKEQQALRKEYIQTFRKSFKNQLHSVKVVDEEGNDVTPQALKDSKQKKNGGFTH
ncbi:DUF896 domain-containing protein [Alkalihalophilus pseudofirmus]|uniref:UPF0291 protein RYX45_08260 n=2 Tax=Alkalihalophilus TaxID=2893060 RepID=A0AAJ2NL22_ALKPS|nr:MULTISPECIES: DUF896 domain-containing protein [Alkalihalophilus]ERN53323.1 hypothetical protein A33I_11855 [Alkalihalophilus marmarensis DSM 21297]MCM3489479.1 DUF896 domain-containing protein [Alkalihalophilus marmarensis]MDV2885172.1 DUF896 domain-containing protein [Alkalihalophilus pseudofirmus]WEG15523.1 DUF896 domain-containing protein [Alkalihalophilus pseudofirmus]